MTMELMVTIALAAIGGLCVLMWNTDGSVDWISSVGGLLAAFIWFMMIVWNAACSTLAWVGSAAVRTGGDAVRSAISAQAWSSDVLAALFVLQVVLQVLPFVFKAARKARR